MANPPKSHLLVDIAGFRQFDPTRQAELVSILNNMSAAIYYLDRWGVITFANRKACQKHPFAEVKGKGFLELIQHWADPNETQRELMQVARTGVPSRAVRERTFEHGVECWFSVDKLPVSDTDNQVVGVILVILDITADVEAERALRESEARYKAFIFNSADAIWRYDLCPPVDTRLGIDTQVKQILQRALLAECNETLAALFDAASADDVIGIPLHRSGSLSGRKDVSTFVEQGYKLDDSEFTRQGGSLDSPKTMQTTAIGIVENGFLTRAWGITRDISSQKRNLDHMEYLANHDSLTRLPNRTLLYSTVENTLQNLPGQNRLMALLLIDLDRFKEINDTLGHRAGDSVLQQLGPRLEAELSEMDGMVARLGGDEFAIFLPRIRNSHQAVVMGHRFLDCLTEPFDIENIRSEVSASIGISIYPTQAQDLSTLMRYADVAMYHAKSALKGVSVYDPEFDPHSPTRLELVGALRRAVREEGLMLHFQPKIDMKSHKVYGFEALLRWNHPVVGMVPPGEFIPIAEKSNMMYPMTCWVMENAIKQCAIWRNQGYDITIAINLSARNVTDDRLPNEVKKLLERYQLSGKHVEMEITESVLLVDPKKAKQVMEEVAELGVVFSVDDFGTGYSSLAYLKRLPVETLKIDKSFVLGMLDDEQDEIIVNSTINLAHNLGIKVVAEGVETDDVYQRLHLYDCDSVQGFFIAKPMSIEAASQWLGSSQWAF